MSNEWLTKEVAEILGVSIPTVRNYAKKLEAYNHEFKKRKQARIWTDTEIGIVKQAQDLYNDNDYPLEMCFQYVIASRNVGEEQAKELLKRPVSAIEQDHSPQLQKVEQNILKAINDIKAGVTPNDSLLEDNQHYIKEIEALKTEISTIEKERDQLKKEMDHVKSLNMWQFRKWKQENTEL